MDERSIEQLHALRWFANWDGSSLAYAGYGIDEAMPASGFAFLDVPVEDGAPVPENVEHRIAVGMLMWPVEQLLARPFSLPLKSPRLLDAEILMQEAEEQAGDIAEAYWLAWHADACGSGVCGILFGLPESVRKALQAQADWRQCGVVTPDIWIRLTAWRLSSGADTPLFVLDEDRDGLFVGLHDGEGWRGMRRLNRAAWKPDADLLEDALRSLRAMGLVADVEVSGRLSASLVGMLADQDVKWAGETVAGESLPARHEANLAAAAKAPQAQLNFRHGSWRKREAGRLHRWKHTLVLAAAVAAVMLVGGLWQLHLLGSRADSYRGQIEAAFHRGLPAEKVMLDPLAQLRMANGAAAAGKGGDDFLRQLALIGKASSAVKGWRIREIGFDDEGMQLFGTAADFAMVNRIRDALASTGAAGVIVEDTEAEEKQVRFRLRWSKP